jgi:hypothetical protein
VTNVLICFQISFETHSRSHGIATCLCRIDRSLDSSTEFELVGLNRNNLDKRHLFDQLLGSLVVKAVLFQVPAGTLNEHTSDVGTVLDTLSDLLGVTLIKNNSI